MKKEDFLFKDRMIRGISADEYFRVSVVKTTEVVQRAARRHDLSMMNKVLLGRALTGACLLTSGLKGEERISLKFEGNGPASMVFAEANSLGEIRGYVKHPEAKLDLASNDSIGDGLGVGLLTVSKVLYNEADVISGTVELLSGNISEDIAYYLHQSEQVQSAVHLDVAIDENGEISSAGGVLIQALPGAPDERSKTIQENLRTMPPVAELFNSGNYIDDILKDVMAPFKVREIARNPVDFFCRCTRDRFLGAMQMLPAEDLKDLSDESQELVCHYCNEKYEITRAEILDMLQEKKAQLN